MLAALYFLTTGLYAGNVSIHKARIVATNYINYLNSQHQAGINPDWNANSQPYVLIQEGNPVFYTFNTNPGFIIISAEDAFTPVIGYSFEGSFDLERASENYRSFIDAYVEQILYIRHQGLTAEPDVAQEWQELSSDKLPSSWSDRDNRNVAPLLSSTWDQGSPYNMLCPEDPAGPGGHTWVGCVATAMAQIMYYWRYPATGEGSHCYMPWNYSYGTQCADFGNTEYAWDGMINSIDYSNALPNAELQYHCAVSVDMGFSPDGSGAYSFTVPDALAEYFRYYDAQYNEKDWYSQVDWTNLLKADLDLGHPLYYSGFSATAGHAFVCDGYQDDNFHFNFGWSGSSNGYYSLYSVGGFSNGQACVSNFVPSDPVYPYHNTGNLTISQKSGSVSDGSGPVNDYLNNLDASWLIDAHDPLDSITGITLTFSKFNVQLGDTVKVYDGNSVNDTLLGTFTGNTVPAAMTGTKDEMLITFVTDNTGTALGWYAQFKAHNAVFCEGITELTDPEGTFDDGSGNYYYHNYSTCFWRIQPPGANTITLTFNRFDIEDGYDFVVVFDGNTKIAQYSGHQIPPSIMATSGTMTLAWYSNSNTNFQGWEATYVVDNVGIEENNLISKVKIYPNPANNLLHVQFENQSSESTVFNLYNSTGKLIQSQSIQVFPGSNDAVIDVSGFAPGLYFLEMYCGQSTLTRKVTVQH